MSEATEPAPEPTGVRLRELLLVLAYCALVLGIALVRGRELSVHEAVLPETARAMYADGDWLVPKRGDLPWLENPPLPQWATVAVASLFGRCDRLWIVRLPGVLAGTGVALLVAWLAGRLLGRRTGLLAGLVTASTYEIARYSWLAEDEIFLCLLVTGALVAFGWNELVHGGREERGKGLLRALVGARPTGVLVFFLLLGATSLVKGPGFGAVLVLVAAAGFLALERSAARLRRYAWLPGWLLAAALTLAWPWLVTREHPDVLELWSFLLTGRVSGGRLGEPFWYYAVALLWTLLPWTPFAWLGLRASFREARQGDPTARFLLSWALLIPLLLSIPDGKHHHYLLHALPAWAILAARGLVLAHARVQAWSVRARSAWTGAAVLGLPAAVGVGLLARGMPGPAQLRWLLPGLLGAAFLGGGALAWRAASGPAPRRAALGLFLFFGGALAVAHAGPPGTHHDDALFLREVGARELDAPLAVDMELGALRGFHCLFHLGSSVVPLHNLTFLRAEELSGSHVYVVTRGYRRDELARYGTPVLVASSERSGRSDSPEALLTLFRLDFRPDLARVSRAGVHVSPLQAMYLAEGPFLGVPQAEPGEAGAPGNKAAEPVEVDARGNPGPDPP